MASRQFFYPLVSYSITKFKYDGEEILCHCEKLASRQTSWIDANLGRRFYGCPDFKVR